MDPTTNPTPTPIPQPPVGGIPPQTPVSPVPPTDPLAEQPANIPVGSEAVPQPTPANAPVAGIPTPTPVNPVFRPTNIDGVNGATIATGVPSDSAAVVNPVIPAQPEPMLASQPSPEPVAPATPPTTGTSIDGIVPNDNPFAANSTNTPPNVSFTDPATQPEPSAPAQSAAPEKKKSNKATLIVLSIIAFIVAAALAVVLVLMVMGVGPFGSGDSSSGQATDTSNILDNDDEGGNTTSSDNGNSEDESGTSDDGGTVSSGDTIVCAMTQAEESEGVSYTQNITVTLYFTNNNFSRASFKVETITDSSNTPAVTTMDMTASEMLSMDGIDLTAAGMQVNADGSVSATKEQVLQAIDETDSGLTCISPSAM